MTENEVVRAVAAYLVSEGYRIDRQLTTLEQGIDIDAVHKTTGERLLIEAKGGTSSKEATARFGKPFTSNQAKTHVSVAFYYGAKLLQQYASESVRVALAFPDDMSHRALVDKIEVALNTLGILVFFVDASGTVHRLSS